MLFNAHSGALTESESLSLAISPGNFTEARQAVEYLFKMIEKHIEFHEAEKIPSWFIDGRTARITFNGKETGFLGEIHPRVLGNWRIRMPVALLEINLDEIIDELVK